MYLTRRPYVGKGADGARRSAVIDREEMDCIAPDDPRRQSLAESAAAWDAQAAAAEMAWRVLGDPNGQGNGWIGYERAHDLVMRGILAERARQT